MVLYVMVLFFHVFCIFIVHLMGDILVMCDLVASLCRMPHESME
jgi:hypothetical protein